MFEYESSGFFLAVYPARIEVRTKKRSQTIAIGDVAQVMVQGRPKRLLIVTSDGKHYEYQLGRECEGARAAIASQLRPA